MTLVLPSLNFSRSSTEYHPVLSLVSMVPIQPYDLAIIVISSVPFPIVSKIYGHIHPVAANLSCDIPCTLSTYLISSLLYLLSYSLGLCLLCWYNFGNNGHVHAMSIIWKQCVEKTFGMWHTHKSSCAVYQELH